MSVAQNRINCIMLNTHSCITTAVVEILITNCRKAFVQRHVNNVCGYGSPHEWEQFMINRLNNEPLMRLLWICIMHSIENGISLADVLNADPVLWINCLAAGDILPYNTLYGDIDTNSPNNAPQN